MQPMIAAQMFRNLVRQAQGKEAAAAMISSAVGHSISIGSLSRIEHGNAEVPLLWAWALMDGTGNRCFDEYRVQTEPPPGDACPYELIGETSREHGESLEASLRAARSETAQDWAQAAVEHREAADKHAAMAALCEARSTGPVPLRGQGG
ncbi:hypothetical protein [Pseudooceanicola nanhaiensis]|uniref:hypothetical protein n=1 Tax=Pseudooceanicola nanhaiensis TaxID=375761 RepID=UPI001CD5EFC4|nr:hypothetical protein [Pseudooceanicola nanhaiensis]MCA0919694.1 hypothetical protein [Pseudooceanicola nanhaiensis]